MADLTDLQSAATTKIIGADGAGIETNPLAVDSSGNITTNLIGGGNVATVTAANALKVDGSAVTQPISATALPLPSGAATSAKQPNFGPAGTPSADVLSIQGITSMTPLKVDGSGFTQPVSGTVAATQSGAWNITNITGSISLPTGAATETTLGGVLTTAAFQARVNTLGQKTMANSTPMVIASDQTSIPVAATQSGTWTVAQGTAAALSGAWPIKLTDGTNTMPTADVAARASFHKITDGTNTMPTLDTASRSGYIRVTDGTNTQPTGDAVGRAIFHKITDGTNTAAVKAASTATVAADPSLVIAHSPNSPLPAGTNRIGKVRLVDDNDARLDLARDTAVPAGTRALLVTGEDSDGVARAIDVRVDPNGGTRRLQIEGKVSVTAPVAPPATTSVTLSASTPLSISNDTTTSYVITNGKTFYIQQIACGCEGDTSERGSCIEVSYYDGAVEHLVERLYINGFTQYGVLPDTPKARDGTTMTGNGTTKTIRIKRRRLSGSSQEVDAVVRGYEA